MFGTEDVFLDDNEHEGFAFNEILNLGNAKIASTSNLVGSRTLGFSSVSATRLYIGISLALKARPEKKWQYFMPKTKGIPENSPEIRNLGSSQGGTACERER